MSHPAVLDAGVIGVPDPSAGELPKAYVVRKESGDITEEELVKFIEERVAPYKALRGGVQFIDEIPRSPSGKILRRILKEMEKANTQQAKKDENLEKEKEERKEVEKDEVKEEEEDEDEEKEEEEEENVLKSKYEDVAIPEMSWTEFVFQHFDKYGDRMAIVSIEGNGVMVATSLLGVLTIKKVQ